MTNSVELFDKRKKACEKYVEKYDICVNNKKNKFVYCYILYMEPFHNCIKKLNFK